ncbi:MAG: DUF1730 domain-containing protein [Clostridia bacterium]|nr:DUF1730 domain-containing protein [Clostridia bacterium]
MKNNYKNNILQYVRSLGITEVGVAGDGRTYSNIVCLFPYFVGKKEGSNLSMYAYGKDYHVLVEAYLVQIQAYIYKLFPKASFSIHVDKGDGDDKAVAYSAGLGFFGKNSLLINDTYGSYVFIGYIKTDIILPPDAPLNKSCLNCGACISACPGKAIKDGIVQTELCASAISQKRGSLTDKEAEILIKSGLAWGCDTCQLVCPHNKHVETTPLSPFQKDLQYAISPFVISNRAFQAAYKDRAFSWRGKSVLNRNLEIINMHTNASADHNK